MPDIHRSMMIFKLRQEFSKDDLQKSYKKLVKKYHPDSNPKNQDWSHKKMTEINLAYEICCDFLVTKEKPNKGSQQNVENNENNNTNHKHNKPFHYKKSTNIHKNKTLSPDLHKIIKQSSTTFALGVEKFFEYGLENRLLRHEGVRRFRYRECIRLIDESLSTIFQMEKNCVYEYDHFAVNLFIRFTGNFYEYIQLSEKDIPHHPLINKHWDHMEDYLISALKDYITPFLIKNYKKMNWKTLFTHCWNQLVYLRKRFPDLERDKTFLILYNLADSYKNIRKEESESGVIYFKI